MRACHTQNESGYKTFFRIETVPKKIWIQVSSSRVADSIIGGHCKRRRTCAIDAGGRTCIVFVSLDYCRVREARYQVKKSLHWEIMETLATAGNDLRVKN